MSNDSGGSLRLHVDVQGELREAALACEAEVFLRWFGNTREQLQEEYGPYDSASMFIVVADDALDVKAACRIITPGLLGLKTLNDVCGEPWHLDGAAVAAAVDIDPEVSWDVGTLGVRRGQGGRGMVAAAALYHGLIAAMRVNQIHTLLTIVDAPVRCLIDSIGLGMHALPGATPGAYLGSPDSIPVYGHRAPWLDYQRRTFPDAYRLIVQGIGLDGIDIPGEEEFVLDLARHADRLITLPTVPVRLLGTFDDPR
jgi:hypothetical protein